MKKRELKFYEAPAMEVVKMEMEGMLCASFNAEDPDLGDDI